MDRLLGLKMDNLITTCVRHEIMWIVGDYGECPLCSIEEEIYELDEERKDLYIHINTVESLLNE